MPAAPPVPAADLASAPTGSSPPNRLWAWFTGGNALTRIGVVILFFGVAFLLKYFAERFTIPIELRLAPRIDSRPPQPPADGGTVSAIVWSLSFRFWAWRHDTYTGARANVRLFLLYHDDRRSPRLPHSTGLEKGLIGLVNVFASDAMAGTNNVVIAHEMLHTFGATDKYDLATNLPLFPDGYAEPERMPRVPQQFAEIMGGRIPISPLRADQPDGLHRVVIGPLTAREINWRAP